MKTKQIQTEPKPNKDQSSASFTIVPGPAPKPASPGGDFLFGVKLFLIGGLVVFALWLLNRFVS
jgi:hypothetical protein